MLLSSHLSDIFSTYKSRQSNFSKNSTSGITLECTGSSILLYKPVKSNAGPLQTHILTNLLHFYVGWRAIAGRVLNDTIDHTYWDWCTNSLVLPLAVAFALPPCVSSKIHLQACAKLLTLLW